MDLNRLRELVAAPMACLFVILVLCLFAVQKPVSTGILVPMMRKRADPLGNCEFNGFTVHLRQGGSVSVGDLNREIPREMMFARIREAQGDVWDDTIFVIADPDVSYGDFASLLADIHQTVPSVHIAVVTRAGQVQAFLMPGKVPLGPWADRCQFEWPAVAGQPREPGQEPIPLPGGHISAWRALRGR